jgi:hypothetical protein
MNLHKINYTFLMIKCILGIIKPAASSIIRKMGGLMLTAIITLGSALAFPVLF